MNNKSLWRFENPEEVSEYSLPKHNSQHFIDVDFVNELLYIYEEGSQKGIEYFIHEKTQEALIKKNICSFLEKSTKEKIADFLRICFDFENNVILIKLNNGLELSFYYLDLIKLKQKIIGYLNLETISSKELSNEVEAMMLLNYFESASETEKIKFLQDVVELKNISETTKEYNETVKKYTDILEKKQKVLVKYFKLYLLGKISKKEAEDIIINVCDDES